MSSEAKPKLEDEKMIMKEDAIKTSPPITSVSKNMQSDVVELLRQVLQWTPLYRPGLNTALIQAAKVGSLGCVKILLSSGAEIDTEDDNGDTPFVHAFRCRYLNVMSHLCQQGCNTEIAKIGVALSTLDASFVRECVKMGVPVENEDWDVASEQEINILLVDLSLDPFEGQYGQHCFEDSPFLWAVQEGRPEVVELMVKNHPCSNKYTQEERNHFLETALFRAIRSKRRDNVKLLIERLEVCMECRDLQDRTPLLIACGHDEDTALYLLRKGADVKVVDGEGLSALHWAACSGQKETCRWLLRRGVWVEVTANLGATPLMVACSSRKTEIVDILLTEDLTTDLSPALSEYPPMPVSTANSADPNVKTPEGWTALHVAVRACVPSPILHSLIRKGANPDVSSSTLSHNNDPVPASTPLLIAIALNSLRMLHILLNARCDIDMPGMVHWATIKDGGSCGGGGNKDGESGGGANVLSSSSPPSFSSDSDTRHTTPVQLAILSRAFDIAVVLIKLGCKIDSSCFDACRVVTSLESLDPSTTTSLLSLTPLPEDKLELLRQVIWEASSQPSSLKHLSRLAMRRCMVQGDLSTLLSSLPHLPPSLFHYLLLRDLFEHTFNF